MINRVDRQLIEFNYFSLVHFVWISYPKIKVKIRKHPDNSRASEDERMSTMMSSGSYLQIFKGDDRETREPMILNRRWGLATRYL